MVMSLSDYRSHEDGEPTQAYADQPTLGPDQAGHTLLEYSTLTGLSLTTIRRKIRRGELAAVLVAGRHGPEYRIPSGDHPEWSPLSTDPAQLEQATQAYAGHPSQPMHAYPEHPSQPYRQPLSSAGVVELAGVIRDQQEQIARLNDERAELYGRLGFYQARMQALEDQVKMLAAPAPAVEATDLADQATVEMANHPPRIENGPDSSVPQALERPDRPWWRRWVGWVVQPV